MFDSASEGLRSTATAWSSGSRIWGSGDRSTVRAISTAACVNDVSTSRYWLSVAGQGVPNVGLYLRQICEALVMNESYCW